MPKARVHFKSLQHAGFTLIEVMVALLILSVVVGALSFAVTQSTRNIGQLKQRQFALWVAQNNLNLHLIGAQSGTQGESNFAGINFLWKISRSNTDTKNFNKITIKVANKKVPDYSLAQLIAFKDESEQ